MSEHDSLHSVDSEVIWALFVHMHLQRPDDVRANSAYSEKNINSKISDILLATPSGAVSCGASNRQEI